MEDTIGSCVICAQNLCVDNFSSLPCGHTFHYNCILRWLCCSEQCPTCRAHTSPRNIVKRLYFAKFGDKAMNGIESSTAATNHNNKFAPTVNENVLSVRTPENDYGNWHGNDQSCSNINDYDNDSEGGGDYEWAMSINGADGDSTNGNDSSVIALERSESLAESEAESEEELDYHERDSDADIVVTASDASFSNTPSVSLGTLSELFSEIDAVSISSLNHNNVETSDSFDDHDEFDDDSGNTYASPLLIGHGSDDDYDNSSVDNNSSDSEESDDNDGSDYYDGSSESGDDYDLSEYGHFDHLAVDVRIFNQHIS